MVIIAIGDLVFILKYIEKATLHGNIAEVKTQLLPSTLDDLADLRVICFYNVISLDIKANLYGCCTKS